VNERNERLNDGADQSVKRLPLACSLSGPEQARRRGKLEEICEGCLRTVNLEDGHEFFFPGSEEWAFRLTEFTHGVHRRRARVLPVLHLRACLRARGWPDPAAGGGSGGHQGYRRGDVHNPNRMREHVDSLKRWAGRLKAELYALYLAYRDPRVPLYARVFAAIVVGYAFSPIDLIPDPIPVLGYLDDLVLIPLGAALAIKMIPDLVLVECREKARRALRESKPVNRVAAAVVVVVWLALAALAVRFTVRLR
jgi:uncharacterized membrane protein YkvA (DUF1232 family)